MIRDDPSRSELIRPGLAVRVDPVRLLYLPNLFFSVIWIFYMGAKFHEDFYPWLFNLVIYLQSQN